MAAVVLVEAVAIVLLVVLVAGLLRSHADILRALHRLGVDIDDGQDGASTSGLSVGSRRDRPVGIRALSATTVRAATDLTGVSPEDEALRIAVNSPRHDTLLAFLTTGCTTCSVFWKDLAQPGLTVPGGARVVIVVHSPEEESLSRVRSYSPSQVPVLMSSQAWDDYGVEFAPYFVYVSGTAGAVAGEGSAATWSELASFLSQAIGDRAATRSAEAGPSSASGDRVPSRRQLADRQRGLRIDDDLLQAGIRPGDPQLYPTHLDSSSRPGDAQGPV